MKPPQIIAFSTRVYQASLFLYPTEYRRDYGRLMVQLFRDVSHETWQQHGWGGLMRWWCRAAFDLFGSVVEQWSESPMRATTLVSSTPATFLSVILSLPALLSIFAAAAGIELPLASSLITDDSQPTLFGVIVMLISLLGLPVAFLINGLSMVTKADEERPSFKPTLPHAFIGVSVLLFVLSVMGGQVAYELRPLLTRLGSLAGLGQTAFFIGLLILPLAFLFNHFPPLIRLSTGGTRTIQPTSVNLIIGAVLLLVLLILGSAILLEVAACTSGVPNCD